MPLHPIAPSLTLLSGLVVVGALLLELAWSRRRELRLSPDEALAWSGFWCVLAVGLGAAVSFDQGRPLLGFLDVWLAAKTVTAAQVLALALLFRWFDAPAAGQDRLLGLVVALAVVARPLGTWLAAEGSSHLPWLAPSLSALLLYSALWLLSVRHDSPRVAPGRLLRLADRLGLSGPGFAGRSLRVRGPDGSGQGTALGGVLVSALAVLGLLAVGGAAVGATAAADPGLVLLAEASALMGMRALYVALAAHLVRLRRLKTAVAACLGLAAVFGLASGVLRPPPGAAFAMIAALLALGLAGSWRARDDPAAFASPLEDRLQELALHTLVQARRVLTLVLASTLLLVGLIGFLLPYPGTPLVLAALGLFASEFVWARRWLAAVRARIAALRRDVAEFVDGLDTRGEGEDEDDDAGGDGPPSASD